jgi:hypothetical protein
MSTANALLRFTDINTANVTVENGYKGIRLYSKDYNFYYGVYCNNEHELYEMKVNNQHQFSPEEIG